MQRTLLALVTTELKETIKGSIFTHLVGDTLIVDIYNPDFHTWRYTCNLADVSYITETTCKILTDLIIEQYRTDILKKHFFLEKI